MIRKVEFLKDYRLRSTGWVQDASDFDNLYRFVSVFSHNSKYRLEVISKIDKIVEEPLKTKFKNLLKEKSIALSYGDIVGTAPSGSRKENTICNGIGQAALKGQKREFQGDWPTDNFLRWAEVLQFIYFEPSIGKYIITSDGDKFVNCEEFEQQKELLIKKLMMYPPALRILTLINDKPQNKFTLGEKLGFIGESGFTYITEDLFLKKYFSANIEEKKKIKSDFEGSSDKYARQICSWLNKLNLIKPHIFNYTFQSETLSLKGYKITVDGENFLRKAKNVSKHVLFGMLSMEKNNKENHCKRRALILDSILRKNRNIAEIYTYLANNNIETSREEIFDDILSLKNIGLNIIEENNKFNMKEKIVGLSIPNRVSLVIEDEIEKKKKELRIKLKHINHDLLNLLDYAYSKSTSRFFEVYVAKVYKEICEKVYLLGGPSKPDVVVNFDDFLIIIDAKAYKEGFDMPIQERDKMVRYIEEYKKKIGLWVKDIIDERYNSDFYYQFVSSSFYNTESKMEDIRTRTNISGSLINAENLLCLVDKFIAEKIISKDVFSKNAEIII